MSIYPVKLSEWYPPGDEHYEYALMMVKSTKCLVCGKIAQYRYAMGHHSLPWGYGDVWCSKKCFRKQLDKIVSKKKIR